MYKRALYVKSYQRIMIGYIAIISLFFYTTKNL